MTRSLSLFAQRRGTNHRDCVRAIGFKGGSRREGSPDQSEQCVIWDSSHYPALAVCAGGGNAGKLRRSPVWSMKRYLSCVPNRFTPGDAVGIGIHTANALRGYEIGKMARSRGAYVIFGGIHATLYPEEAT